MLDQIPCSARKLLERLTEHGYEANLVGGCVRDLLRSEQPSDYDMTTSATPAEMMAVFSDHRVIPTGVKHGTLTVMRDGVAYEITTYRVDGPYADGRHPDGVRFTCSLREDLARRDFTVNAIAYSPVNGVTDPFGGASDIEARVIRAVGEPRLRFTEDALRILRAIRFSATLGYRIEPQTAAAAFALRDRLSLVSPERIRVELVKLVVGKEAERVLLAYPLILFSAFPHLAEIGGRWQEAVRRSVSLPCDAVLRLAALLAPLGAERAEEAMRALKFDHASLRRASAAIASLAFPLSAEEQEILALLAKLGKDVLFDRIALHSDRALAEAAKAMLEKVLCSRIPYSVSMLAVDGDDLIRMGIPRGKRIGEMLNVLLFSVMHKNIINEKEPLLAYARQYASELDA